MFATAYEFDHLAPRFADCFRVLGLTRRGAGESDKPESGYDTGTLSCKPPAYSRGVNSSLEFMTLKASRTKPKCML